MELPLLTADAAASSVLPALSLLPHRVQTAAPDVAALLDARSHDAVLVDARSNLVAARSLCRLLRHIRPDVPVLAVLAEDELVAVSSEWVVDDILLPGASPAEVDARLRLLRARPDRNSGRAGAALVLGELVIDAAAYSVRLRGRALPLTYKEFELLRYLAQHAGQVFSRAQLLQEVWGHDFFGGPRTVDVHVRRLRAKLGAEHEQMIGTVRNVGYKFVRPPRNAEGMTVVAETDNDGTSTTLNTMPHRPTETPSADTRAVATARGRRIRWQHPEPGSSSRRAFVSRGIALRNTTGMADEKVRASPNITAVT